MSMTESGRNWGRQGLQAVDFDYPVIAYGEPPTAEVVVALVGLLRLDRGYDFTPIRDLLDELGYVYEIACKPVRPGPGRQTAATPSPSNPPPNSTPAQNSPDPPGAFALPGHLRFT